MGRSGEQGGMCENVSELEIKPLLHGSLLAACSFYSFI
jgi:hypothetical protein